MRVCARRMLLRARTHSPGNSSCNGCNRGAAVEADTIRKQQLMTIREQQLMTIREQQLMTIREQQLYTETCPARTRLLTKANEGAVTERAK